MIHIEPAAAHSLTLADQNWPSSQVPLAAVAMGPYQTILAKGFRSQNPAERSDERP
jgi:hypothetical protein